MLSRCFSARVAASVALVSLMSAPLSALAASPEITVYNQGFGLVKDRRSEKVSAGIQDLNWQNVPSRVETTSVRLKPITGPALNILEQNFRYDLINKTSVLNRMLGQKIRFYRDKELMEGTLLSVPSAISPDGGTYTTSDLAVKTLQGVLLTNIQDIIVDKVPEDLYATPTLVWKVQSPAAGTADMEVSYLTQGLGWNADYVAVLDNQDKTLDLTGWVTVTNQSGAAYPDAKLKLVAGEVARAQEPNMPYPMVATRAMMMSDAMVEKRAGGFAEEKFFEYHLYTLNGETTLGQNETKQIQLLSTNGVALEKHFVFDPNESWRYARSQENGVHTVLQFKNTQANHLGMPLPKGKLKVLKADSTGALQFVGEDWIQHTPKDETLKITLGDAFDLVAERRVMSEQRVGKVYDQTMQVTLKNHGDKPVVIDVIEHPYGDWKVLQSSVDGTQNAGGIRESVNRLVFKVTVPPSKNETDQTVLTYTLRTKQ
jgi:hypothetical protein